MGNTQEGWGWDLNSGMTSLQKTNKPLEGSHDDLEDVGVVSLHWPPKTYIQNKEQLSCPFWGSHLDTLS